MTDCNLEPIRFPSCKGRVVEAGFSGGAITSDGGAMLLRQADRMLGLTDQAARGLTDSRRKASCRHSFRTMVRQQVYALALGYEDLNDHDELRSDPVLQTAVDADEPLAGASTLCRLENRMGRAEAVRLHGVLVEHFIASFPRPPRRLVLDFDATDDPVHGMQEGRFFHGYYDRYCFLPLYVFCGDRPLVAYLRPGKSDGARHAWAVLALLVKRLRRFWPKLKIVFRGDSGFCRPRMLSWCERNHVGYVVGIARNAALAKKAKPIMELAAMAHEASGKKVRVFDEFPYAAKTWRRRSRPDRQGRALRARREPALCRHQSEGRAAMVVRPVVLRPRRHGEPDQGTATGPVLRPHQLPRMVAEPIPAAALRHGLCVARSDPPDRPRRQRARQRLRRRDPTETTGDRRRRAAKHPESAVAAVQFVSPPSAVPHRRRPAETRIRALRRKSASRTGGARGPIRPELAKRSCSSKKRRENTSEMARHAQVTAESNHWGASRRENHDALANPAHSCNIRAGLA